MQSRVAALRWQLFILFCLLTIVTFFVSRLLAKKLVSEVNLMSKAVEHVVQSGNLDLQLKEKSSNDEMDTLADTKSKKCCRHV